MLRTTRKILFCIFFVFFSPSLFAQESSVISDLDQLEQKLLNIDWNRIQQDMLLKSLEEKLIEAEQRAQNAEQSSENAQQYALKLEEQVSSQQEQLKNALNLCDKYERKLTFWKALSGALAATTTTLLVVLIVKK